MAKAALGTIWLLPVGITSNYYGSNPKVVETLCFSCLFIDLCFGKGSDTLLTAWLKTVVRCMYDSIYREWLLGELKMGYVWGIKILCRGHLKESNIKEPGVNGFLNIFLWK